MSSVSESWQRNSEFLIAKSILRKLHAQELINHQELKTSLAKIMEHYHPPVEALDCPKYGSNQPRTGK